ncbi:MAG: hypothetical protein K0R28_696 [Paenibacillus sp.]|jgi:predicted TIM-barrel fold metal-dependent hydrolase|nr:hypothetical protein [Paenibacillus sp.]
MTEHPTRRHDDASAVRERKAVHPAMRLMDPFKLERAIDLTAFIGQWPTRLQIRADASDLSEMADRLGLEAMCVSHIASIFGFDTRSGNEALFRDTAADERLWPFAMLNPVEAGWELELDWAIRQGAKGIRIVPGYHGYSLDSPQAAELVARMSASGLPLHICFRLEDDRLVHPRIALRPAQFHELAELLRLTGETPIVLSGLRAREWQSVSEQLNDDHRTDRVMLDLWFTNGPIAAMASLCQSNLADRLGYGSCTPIQVAEATVLQLAAADIDADKRAALCRSNAARLLGLQESREVKGSG